MVPSADKRPGLGDRGFLHREFPSGSGKADVKIVL